MERQANRFALFVDAGYLYAAAGELCHGVDDRSRIALDLKLPAELAVRGSAQAAGEHLRTYWYDAAENLIPTPAQQAIAQLAGVKLRLGRLTMSGQKGVDSLIVRDLIKLAWERAIDTAFLLSGDEDLMTGVTEAQDCGLKVVLMRIERANASVALLREADDYLQLDRAFLESYVTLQTAPSEDETGGDTHIREHVAYAFGRQFGLTWLSNASPTEVNAQRVERPRIPAEIDRDLLRGLLQAEQVSESARLDFETRHALRKGYWSALEEAE